MSTPIGGWLRGKRDRALAEIERLRIRIEVLDQMLAELPPEHAEAAAPRPPVLKVTAAPKIAPKKTAAKNKHHPNPLTPANLKAVDILRQAGAEGLSARDYATLENLPIKTASARLSIVKTAGLALLNDGKYFVQHSSSEDNNHEISA